MRKPIYRGLFSLIYAYGLRISEATKLPVTAIASDSMTLRVIGKRNKERILPLTEPLRDDLRKLLNLTTDGLLMRVSAEAVKELCAKKRHLGGLPGILSVLHTWNGQLG